MGRRGRGTVRSFLLLIFYRRTALIKYTPARIERETREDQQWEASETKLEKQLENLKLGLALQKGGPRGEKYRLRAEDKLKEAEALLKEAKSLLKQREDDLRITENNAQKAQGTPEEATLKSMLSMAKQRVDSAKDEIDKVEKKVQGCRRRVERAQRMAEAENRFLDLYRSLNRGGDEVNLLEAMILIAMNCGGTLSEKINFVFDLFDFDKSGTLSKEEITILLSCSCRALEHVGGLPESEGITLEELESMVVRAYASADLHTTADFTKFEFKKASFCNLHLHPTIQ